ncbi:MULTISPECIES: sulfite exporter TauE/SafE family protein [unclassified Kitasatospora]|uniref:sulfite exporter TauE/SafE family protein n=1 Tax=unclassified Kitasatospora TaxID=2633591 RepID=UPI001ADF7375|nr:sulfite exporter TauE/SafE family protein [Kitasatospora sp. RG8]MBP0450170.1 sulfite exporter TauE/SafE family protein [Kitasatospora sp. RG8]
MTLWEAIAVLVAGAGAGMINVIVGSGTLITFPVLLAIGIPPVTANVSNSFGLVPGSLSGVIGYRRELADQGRRLLRLGSASLLGGLVGAVLLIELPSSAFDAIVPVLILLALVLVVIQPRVAKAVAARRRPGGDPDGGLVLLGGVFLTGIYGGYFGAAQGVLLMALMGMLLQEDLQRINAVKNALAMIVNGVAAVFFLFTSTVNWAAAGLIAVGSLCGGLLGAKVGRKLPAPALRGIIVVVGLAAVTKLLVS